jgi:alginate O-acetyltransferase complex protein AlgI
MNFASPIFLFTFLPLVVLIYYLLPAGYKKIYLVLASLYFYAWGEGEVVVILLFYTAFNYYAGLLLRQYQNKRLAGTILTIGILANIGGLVFYKYTQFFLDNLNGVIPALDSFLSDKIYFPLGISFYTFSAMSYLWDIYREEAPASADPVDAALYICFFPKLIAGPIVRYSEMKPQLDNLPAPSLSNLYPGLTRFIEGLAKKVLIADNLARFSDQVFAMDPGDMAFSTSWMGALVYGLVLYFDFSGYTDMAIGIGRMLGFRLPENFNFPYIAQSISDFWRRWHLSLSYWFRDYFYTPLSLILSRRWNPKLAIIFSVFLAFTTVGLWHGAAWKFIIFGLLHASFLAFEMWKGLAWLAILPRIFRHLYTLLVIMVSTLFFRADSLDHALAYIGKMFSFSSTNQALPVNTLTWILTISAFFLSLPFFWNFIKKISAFAEKQALWAEVWGTLRVVVLIFMLLLSLIFLSSGLYQPFIYFQF